MADVNDMFNEVTKEQSFYRKDMDKVEDTRNKYSPYAKGEYYGHITEVDSKVSSLEGSKNLHNFYEDIGGKMVKTGGEVYVGKTFKGKLWRFLEPSKDDTFESNTSGNKGYLRFCETIGVECPTEVRTIDGSEIEVQILPTLAPEAMLGQPIIAFVDKGREFTNKKGERTFFWDCKFCKKWEGGNVKDISSDGGGIPF